MTQPSAEEIAAEHRALAAELFGRGWIGSPHARATPLTGGVSSDILLIDDGQQPVVLKRALAKLKVAADWRADVSRNLYEQRYLDYVGRFLPTAVPRVLHRAPEQGFFLMEYLGSGYANWKSQLLAGEAELRHAREAARVMAVIHRQSWLDPAAGRDFDSTNNFWQLRLEPYLLATAEKHPAWARQLTEEAKRIAATRLCLVHGDYSPKNILVSSDRLVLVDCEVAWFGEPAFDVAFLLNHLLLKSLYHAPHDEPFVQLAHVAWQTYAEKSGDGEIEPRVARLLPMLLLARIDGKSPVEYLTEPRPAEFVRQFVGLELESPGGSLSELFARWQSALSSFRRNS